MSGDPSSAGEGPSDGTLFDPWIARLFGDRVGLGVFLVALVFLGLCWRVGFFITDSKTVANLLANVADGRLAVVETPYSITAVGQPGLVEVDGEFFGRNYGQVYLAVPLVWALDLLGTLVDLRVLLAGLWSLAVVALGRTAAGLLDRPRLADLGALVGVGTVLVALLATPRSYPFDEPVPLVALQLATLLAAAVGATVLYRLLSLVDGRRVGLAAGLALVLATPVGFWGTLPKRHVFSASLLLLAVFWFALGRRSAGRQRTLARAGAYGALGFLAAIHPFEAVFMLAVLGPLDLATSLDSSVRTHAVVAVVFLVATGPMLATNAAIAGDAFSPPRTLPDASSGGLPTDLGDQAGSPDGGGGGGGSGTGGGSGGDGGGGGSGGGGGGGGGGGLPLAEWFQPLAGVLATAAWIGGYMRDAFVAGLAALGEPGRLYHVFVRSGWIPTVDYATNDFEAVELALLEVLPLAGTLLAVPALATSWLRRRISEVGDDRRLRTRPSPDPVDLLAAGMATVFVLVYLPLVPLKSMVTLRYLLPAMPLVVYLVCRLGPVRTAVAEETERLARGYLATLAIGGLGYLIVFGVIDPAVGEALQFHALVGLATAAVALVAVASWPVHRDARAVAVGLAVPAAATTLFLCSAALWQFQYGTYAVDLARIVAESLPAIG
jgi:uncharacterized membrane protein YgcG